MIWLLIPLVYFVGWYTCMVYFNRHYKELDSTWRTLAGLPKTGLMFVASCAWFVTIPYQHMMRNRRAGNTHSFFLTPAWLAQKMDAKQAAFDALATRKDRDERPNQSNRQSI